MPLQHDSSSKRIAAGEVIAARTFRSVSGETIPVPDGERMVHLQFRRFAGCPVCNLHLHSMVRRQAEIVAAGIREVVVFHSSEEDLRSYAGGLPFAVIADPGKRLYVEFGVESSVLSLLDPRAWWTIVRAVLRSTVGVVRRHDRIPPLRPLGGRFGLPADFLIASDGRVVTTNYGVHADDQWSLDEVLDHARAVVSAETTSV
jgi:peroxiredoxin